MAKTSTTAKLPRVMPWHRRDDEGPEAYEAFYTYYNLEGKRTRSRVAEILGKHVTLINTWANKYDWSNRARAYDTHVVLMKEQEVFHAIKAFQRGLIEDEARDYMRMLKTWRKQLTELEAQDNPSIKDMNDMIRLRDNIDRFGRRIAEMPTSYTDRAMATPKDELSNVEAEILQWDSTPAALGSGEEHEDRITDFT